ncbi:hypothetical protein GOP47_0001544 [Adiantum capillus-veneris]|uniref:Uncharacterized protein n=1 Tax=Adiantum capillus-veneris TaxID=13818 RepID=A0A9D4V9Q9_ADICA|nr:hypothetical protein GOP47_0001544 [Adiantum capillus-veneris]
MVAKGRKNIRCCIHVVHGQPNHPDSSHYLSDARPGSDFESTFYKDLKLVGGDFVVAWELMTKLSEFQYSRDEDEDMGDKARCYKELLGWRVYWPTNAAEALDMHVLQDNGIALWQAKWMLKLVELKGRHLATLQGGAYV